MLGGRSSFGEGGWGNTALAGILPFTMRSGDGQIEPPGGLKFEPSPLGLQNFVLRLGPNRRGEPADLGLACRRSAGPTVSGSPRPLATVMAQAQPGGDPLMVGMEIGQGRVHRIRRRDLAVVSGGRAGPPGVSPLLAPGDPLAGPQGRPGGERGQDQARDARLAVGERLDLTAWARDAKREPIPDVQFDHDRHAPSSRPTPPRPSRSSSSRRARRRRGSTSRRASRASTGSRRSPRRAPRKSATTRPGSTSTQDDRELENPAADRALLREIASITGGKSVAPEELGKQLATLDAGVTESVSLRREADLGQLVLPDHLRRHPQPGVVAPQADRMGVTHRETLLIVGPARAGRIGPGIGTGPGRNPAGSRGLRLGLDADDDVIEDRHRQVGMIDDSELRPPGRPVRGKVAESLGRGGRRPARGAHPDTRPGRPAPAAAEGPGGSRRRIGAGPRSGRHRGKGRTRRRPT